MRALLPRLARMVVMEAEKDLLAAIPAGASQSRRRLVMPP